MFGITFAFAAAVQPGPLQAFLVSQALSRGWRRTLPAAFAPLLSDGPIILLVLFVLTHVPAWLVTLLQGLGGLFLLTLAFGAWKSWRDYTALQAAPPPERQQTLFKAALINLLNPNPYLGWSLVMGPLLLKGWREAPAYGIALLIGFYVPLIACSLGIVLLFASARSLGPKVGRALVGISALALAAFGLYEVWQGVSAFLPK